MQEKIKEGKPIKNLRELADISDLYQVKFRPIGRKVEFRYGVVDTHSDEAKKLWGKKWMLTVDDAILPTYWELDTDHYEIIPLDVMSSEYDDYLDKQYHLAEKMAKKAKGLVGKMFRCGVGDGYASYVVVRESAKTATIEWRGFCADRWHDHIFGSGGTFDKKLIQREVKCTDGLREIFA
jgi:hypothetical protein